MSILCRNRANSCCHHGQGVVAVAVSLSSLSLLAAVAVFVMLLCSMGLPLFNPGCHSGRPHAKIHNVYTSFILLNHFHLMSSNYLPRSMTKAFLVHLKIFVWVTYSFTINHFLLKNSIFHVVVSEQLSNVCLTFSSPKCNRHVPLS